MGRHRIEIEFDGNFRQADWIYHALKFEAECQAENTGAALVDVGMTPVIPDAPTT